MATMKLQLIAGIPTPGCRATEKQLQVNKKLVEEFYNSSGEAKAALIHKDDIQHDPVFIKRAEANKSATTMKSIDFIMKTPAVTFSEPDNRELEILRAECDIIAAVIKRTKADPDPTAPPGRRYDQFRFDVFRVKAKLFEHWDGVDIALPVVGHWR